MLLQVREKGLLRVADRWVLQFLDLDENHEVKSIVAGSPVSLISYDRMMCCSAQRGGTCEECPPNVDVQAYFFGNLIAHITNILNQIQRDRK